MPVVSCTITTRAVNKPTIGLSMEEEMTIRFHGSCISVVEKFVFSGTQPTTWRFWDLIISSRQLASVLHLQISLVKSILALLRSCSFYDRDKPTQDWSPTFFGF